MNFATITFLFACAALVLLLVQWWRQNRVLAAVGPVLPAVPPALPARGPRSFAVPPSIPVGLACPYCRSNNIGRGFQAMTTGGVVMLIVGICLIPVLVGIVFVLASFSMKEMRYRCQNCRKTF